ncbi:TetR/AcrR family transcriptional regulator [Serratia ficaria]|uniref:TetR/AcrR family transcriptional regulator n=1 Tax=Serratia ficaria TaxID=61651 RepID=UPI00077CB803|nr:TetR/AcrR family transcriptional regulator [Serratia ficaria]CAI2079401.1 Potential acrAB operon repressor [Serratia ficaria]CAI2399584.1 Potential acrAB operon repressor [Serratia ficaria]CAI2488992.1 Potential acrAB operon repressor [Serratia ficaria]
MARVSKQQMERNREAIEQVSSQLFRERGLNGVSVNDLMAAVGLTHGGFYGHFASKDQLAAVASRRAAEESSRRWENLPGERSLQALVDGYLDVKHRDCPAEGCMVAALAGDVAREGEDKPVRQAYLSGVQAMLARLQSLSPGQERQQALAQMAMLVGALTLARATRGDALSEQFLDATRQALTSPDPEQK